MTRTQKWSAGTAVLAVLLLLAGWFLLVAPQRSTAAGLRLEAVAAEQANQGLLTEIHQLQAQSAELPAKREVLEAISRKLPADVQLPALVRALTGASAAAGAELQAMAPGVPQALAPADAAAVGSAAAATVSAVPVTLTAGGEFAQLDRFLFELERLDRAFLVTGLTLRGGDGAEVATTSATALAGPLTLEVQGQVFVDAAAVPTATSVPGTTATTPTPTTGTAPAPAAS
ncbi:type 4a pilus biogenesis protein PilO [Vallicoccus soli]|uniref:Type 4a pilus biogenesis protein PilO n=1 Tax=Vallicoccus soli TaxID=2339232 RepID=A0A3A3Z4W5_9ACTN|nr:type 4a pilus biogenesis protein PilO [Vallicoccus soli]RJK96768.1 hypothetical protein D5H78_05710 [Vallicoccus soli]